MYKEQLGVDDTKGAMIFPLKFSSRISYCRAFCTAMTRYDLGRLTLMWRRFSCWN